MYFSHILEKFLIILYYQDIVLNDLIRRLLDEVSGHSINDSAHF